MQAILDAPDKTTWSGCRDYVLLSTLYNSGARVSEIIALRRIDFESTHSQSDTPARQRPETTCSSALEAYCSLVKKMAQPDRTRAATTTLPKPFRSNAESFRGRITTKNGYHKRN